MSSSEAIIRRSQVAYAVDAARTADGVAEVPGPRAKAHPPGQ